MTLTYDINGFRTIGEPHQAHARTEYRTPKGRTISSQGQGTQVRDMLKQYAEGK